ncbi:hypothetical protein CRUP_027073 [Coryphaenoides rupestris]|nr:hypothetical protein CRUP_027073 [Coryphaenoides rupestris]
MRFTLLLVLLAAAQVLSEEMGPKEELDDWTSDQTQGGWLSPDPFREFLRRMTRKPRPHQFIGLMGKRSTGHKINSFVGLMGKRSQEEPDSYEWRTIQNYDRRH